MVSLKLSLIMLQTILIRPTVKEVISRGEDY